MFANSHFALATHVLVALAIKDGTPMSSAALAKSVNTNPAFLRQLLGRLRDAGLVEVTMGPNGGAVLARAATKLSLADVYAAIEPDAPARLHASDPNPACPVGRNIVPLLDGRRVRGPEPPGRRDDRRAGPAGPAARLTPRRRRRPRGQEHEGRHVTSFHASIC
jgi:Rrf2 family protein